MKNLYMKKCELVKKFELLKNFLLIHFFKKRSFIIHLSLLGLQK